MDAEVLSTRAKHIREINDDCRRTFTGCAVVASAAFADMDAGFKTRALQKIRTFEGFNEDNDPHNEHDYFSVEVDGQKVWAKFDYYDLSMKFSSDDPSDPSLTQRVLTICLSEDL